MSNKDIFIDKIGNVRFSKKNKIKNINIRIYQNGDVKVTLPIFSSYNKAVEIVKKKYSWIARQREKQNVSKQKRIKINNNTSLKYLKHKIKFVQNDYPVMKFEIFNSTLKFHVPQGVKIDDGSTQEFIRKGITEALRVEAKEFLPVRVKELAIQYGFRYRKVFIKNAKTLWGSCSSKNNINLNLHLMRLPGRLKDYVILHELTHTKHRNHGKKFWDQLDEYVGDARSLSKELREYRIGDL